jgi:hypothetical protein
MTPLASARITAAVEALVAKAIKPDCALADTRLRLRGRPSMHERRQHDLPGDAPDS